MFDRGKDKSNCDLQSRKEPHHDVGPRDVAETDEDKSVGVG